MIPFYGLQNISQVTHSMSVAGERKNSFGGAGLRVLQRMPSWGTMIARFPGDRSASVRQGTPNTAIYLVPIVNLRRPHGKRRHLEIKSPWD